MASNEYNQEQSGPRSELDEPRRTTESTGYDKSDEGYDGAADRDEGGYGGVSENEPPHHKIHSDDEPLPKPTSGSDDQEDFSTPTGTATGPNYGDDNTEKFQDSRSDEPQTGSYDDNQDTRPTGFDGDNPNTRSTGFGGDNPDTESTGFGGDNPDTRSTDFGDKPSGGFSDPSSAFPDAPVDRTVQEPGYGQDTTGPTTDSSPKGFMQKLKEKLPGKSKTDSPDTMDESPTDAGTPKKGLVSKIKEKLPGHHSSTDTPTDY